MPFLALSTMPHFTQAFGAVASRLRVFQPIISSSTSQKAGPFRQAGVLLFKHYVLPRAALQLAASLFAVQPFSAISSNRVSSSAVTRRRFLSEKRGLLNVNIGHPCIISVFTYGFADSSILKSFLNTVLELNGEQSIEEIQYLPRQSMFQSNPNPAFQTCFDVDVRCRTKSGRQILIEILDEFKHECDLKALIEQSRMLSRADADQNSKKRPKLTTSYNDKNTYWKVAEKLYTIVVTNKPVDFALLQSHYIGETVVQPFLVNNELRHVKQSDCRFGEIPNQIVFLLLNKLGPLHPGQLLTPFERWAHVFRDPALRKGMWRIPKTKRIKDVEALAGGVNEIHAYIDRLNMINLPLHVRQLYEHSVDYHNGAIDDLEERIHADVAERKQTALRMMNEGEPISKVAALTGFTVEVVARLRRDTQGGAD
jgi:hypothetical protein